VREFAPCRYWQISRSFSTQPSVIRKTKGIAIPCAVLTGVLSSEVTAARSGVRMSVSPRAWGDYMI
jgi:hypothetical protein